MRKTGQIERWRLGVSRLELSLGEITKQPGPLLLGISHDDAVGMGLGVVGNECHVRPAKHNSPAAVTEIGSQLVRTRRRAGDDRHPNEIHVEIQVDILDAFVDADDFGVHFFGNQSRECWERQRHVPQRLSKDSAFLPIQWPFR